MFLRPRTILLLSAAAIPCCAQPADNSLAHLRAGEALLKQHNLQSAALEFNQALLGNDGPAWTRVWSLIDLGRIFDATDQRDRAVKEYQAALETKDNTFGALGFANMYLWKAPTLDDATPPPKDADKVVAPTVLERVEPKYSAEALLARFEGTVLVGVSLARDGSISNVYVLKSLGLGLDEAAIEAVRHWKFAPGQIQNEPAPIVTQVEVPFHLPSHTPGWHTTKIQFTLPDGASRPTLIRADNSASRKMSPELSEEADIDAAVSRLPNAAISMEIDTLGVPQKIQLNAASLPIWGEEAIRAIGEWRFTPGPVAVPCAIDLVFFIH